MILTLDFGTSVTKVHVWSSDGMVASAGVPLTTVHPAPGRCEQDPDDWRAALIAACAAARAQAPKAFDSVEVVGCTGARQTMVLADRRGASLGPAILWSDRRAGAEAARLASAGWAVDAGSVAAKIAWLDAHDRTRLEASAWILTPRDLLVWWMTGATLTDATMASRSGLYDRDGLPVAALVGPAASRLAPVVASDRVAGSLTRATAEALGLGAGIPVVIGAGDRACEVLGSGASTQKPMVSWGTTANVSVPVDHWPPASPAVPVELPAEQNDGPPFGLLQPLVLSRSADSGWLLEGGLSAAGSYIDWLGRLTGHTAADLARAALQSSAGARGVLATPWLEGARAPWWQADAGAAFVGLTAGHALADLARAAFEAVAWDVQRCLESTASLVPGQRNQPVGLALAGSGADLPVWTDVLGGITGLPVERRRSGQAASAGAAILAARAVGVPFDLELANPLEATVTPDPISVARYAALRPRADEVASALVGLSPPDGREGGSCG